MRQVAFQDIGWGLPQATHQDDKVFRRNPRRCNCRQTQVLQDREAFGFQNGFQIVWAVAVQTNRDVRTGAT